MKQLIFLIALIIFSNACSNNNTNNKPIFDKNLSDQHLEFYNYAQQSCDYYIAHLDSFIKVWHAQTGFDAAGNLKAGVYEVYLAATLANLYKLNGNIKYIKAAKHILVHYGEYRKKAGTPKKLRAEYKNGIPYIPNFFLPPKYARAAAVVFEANICENDEKKIIQNILAQTADFLMATQEWGPMNRAMLRAEGLLLINKALEFDHYKKLEWETYANTLITDNLREWNIEDAGMYQMIWLYSLCGVAGYLNEPSFINSPKSHYYFEYFKQLHSPAGVIPDFGDAWWRSWWIASIPVMESGAKAFNNANYLWTAQNAYNINFNPLKTHHLDLALKLSEAILWGSNTLNSVKPNSKSELAFDAQIGKKVVFRNGWDNTSTYLLYNFKDEGKSGSLFKNNLRNTLSVSHEKMHHGHSDEQSIVFFMHKNSVLLHDGGYRPILPSGPNGEYRADIFHNKMVFRNQLLDLNNGIVSALKNNGVYNNSQTLKVDFTTNTNCDYSRTKEILVNKGIEHERIINYLKEDGVFVVFDIIKSNKNNNEISCANLWHTQNIIENGENWFITKYDSIGKWVNKDNCKLMFVFPDDSTNKQLLTDDIDRHKQQEKCISQLGYYKLNKGDYETYITVLHPITNENASDLIQNYEFVKTDNCIALKAKINNQTHIIAHKLDLNADNIRDWPKPTYTYNSGKIAAFGFESDANHFYVNNNANALHYYSINCTKFISGTDTLFEQPKNTNEFRTDGKPATADAWKVRKIERTDFLGD
ncbi:MAG: hypothetical protein ACPGLV_09715 [Bacteroidia bacterium]